jgi:hypothetical protein
VSIDVGLHVSKQVFGATKEDQHVVNTELQVCGLFDYSELAILLLAEFGDREATTRLTIAGKASIP